MTRQMPALARRAAMPPSAIVPETMPAQRIFLTASGAPLVPPSPRGCLALLVAFDCPFPLALAAPLALAFPWVWVPLRSATPLVCAFPLLDAVPLVVACAPAPPA